jgi:hypothetical protein
LLCWLCAAFVAGQSTSGRAELAAKARDREAPAAERDRAFKALVRLYPEAALQLAPEVLGDPVEIVRFRAAWLLADAGREDGLKVLRMMSADDGSDSNLPAQALGRTRDPESHELLREVLANALRAPDRPKVRARVAAFASGLSEFADAKDGPLLAQAVRRFWEPGASWQLVEQLGRTGATEAIPVLEEIFGHGGKDWAVVAAGLGLARCGSARGRAYVAERLSDRSVKSPEAAPADALQADPQGSLAGTFILEHMGVPADEPLVPALLAIVSEATFTDGARALAWSALFRVDPIRQRDELLALAWKNLRFDGAARFVVVHDEQQARSAVDLKTMRPKADGTVSPIERALGASAAERRRWRESRNYDF